LRIGRDNVAHFDLFGYEFEKEFSSKKEAQIFFENLKRSYVTELYPVDHCIEKYINLVSKKKSKGSYRWDKFILNTFLTFLVRGGMKEDEPITSLNQSHFEGFQSYLLYEKGLNPATVNRYFSTIKNLFNKLVQWEMLLKSPARYVKKLPENPKPKAVWGEEEFLQVKKSLHSEKDKDIFEFLWLTGARISSAADVRLTDIDWQQGLIAFRTSKGPKQSVKTYYFPLHDKLFKLIKRVLEKRKKLTISHNYLFYDDEQNPINSKNFTGRVRKVLLRSGLRNNHEGLLSLHGLRHSLASRLHEGGLTVNEIKGLLGHSSVTVTEGYIHSDASLLKSKIENIA